MAEVSSYAFDIREITSILIKNQGIREGLWVLAFEFGLGAGLVGPSPADVKPTAFVSVMRLQLLRYNDDPMANPLAVDASKINQKQGDAEPTTLTRGKDSRTRRKILL